MSETNSLVANFITKQEEKYDCNPILDGSVDITMSDMWLSLVFLLFMTGTGLLHDIGFWASDSTSVTGVHDINLVYFNLIHIFETHMVVSLLYGTYKL